jgi:quercetin dioxygenase-like cupin family protein
MSQLQLRDVVKFSAQGHSPYLFHDSETFKSLVVGFEPGQSTPLHPAGPATYYVVEGEGWITEDETRHAVQTGSVVVVGADVPRRIEARTRLIVLAARGG